MPRNLEGELLTFLVHVLDRVQTHLPSWDSEHDQVPKSSQSSKLKLDCER